MAVRDGAGPTRGTARREATLESHWRSTQRRLGLGGCALLVLLGGGLVGLLYGGGAAVAAISIILVVTGLGVLIWFLLTVMEAWANRG